MHASKVGGTREGACLSITPGKRSLAGMGTVTASVGRFGILNSLNKQVHSFDFSWVLGLS